MKLLTKTTLYFITVSLFVFFIGGVGFYKLFGTLIDKRVNKELHSLMHNITNELNRKIPDISKAIFLSTERISIQKVPDTTEYMSEYKDTILYDKFEKLYLPYRKLTFYADVNGEKFRFAVYKSLIETNLLVENIAIAMTALVLLFLLCIYFLNRYIFKRIWADFFNTINKIQHYDLDSSKDIVLEESMIIEFNQLNGVIKKMIDRIQHDYFALKDFTGNISHEIQTPLAIIKSKAELLMQDENIGEKQVSLINEIYNGTTRLSKLNQALILLTKIENHQFPDRTDVNIKEKISFHLLNFESMIESKQLELSKDFSANLVVIMNSDLADILIMNLINNAIRHNITSGKMIIHVEENELIIKNTGDKLKIPHNEIFTRFAKSSKSKGSLGLGLAIVKKICDYYKFNITYTRTEEFHNFCLLFK